MGASFSDRPQRFRAAQATTGPFRPTEVRPLRPRVPRITSSPRPGGESTPQLSSARTRVQARPARTGVIFTAMPVQGSAMFARPGPPGPTGGEPQIFAFDEPSSEWVCVHDLGRLPQITVYDLQGNVRPFVPIENPSDDVTILMPTPPLAGKVVII